MALSRMSTKFRKDPKRSHKDLKYLQYSHPFSIDFVTVRRHTHTSSEEDDDAGSICSMSTNATMDDMPAAGRLIDKYVYQFFGRKIERFANRVSISFLPPDRIAQCLWINYYIAPQGPSPLGVVVHHIHSYPFLSFESGALVAGLKSLVKQSQSNSLYRSAAALAALIRMSTSWHVYGWFFASVAAVEPMLHLETVATALADSCPEKRYFLLLVNLARAQLHFTNSVPGKSPNELAYDFRQDLLRILKSCRSPNHEPLEAISNACLLFAKTSSFVYRFQYEDHCFAHADLSIVETTYFLTIFLMCSFKEQFSRDSFPGSAPNRLKDMVLSTLIDWFERISFSISRGILGFRADNLRCIQRICALRSPFLAISDMQYEIQFPKILIMHYRNPIINHDVFPRRIRATTPEKDNPAIIHTYLKIWTMRARRLLSSPAELEREALVTMKDFKRNISQSKSDEMISHEPSYEELRRSLDRARKVLVCENELTRKFLYARDGPLWSSNDDDLTNWTWYKKYCMIRHTLGTHLLSDMDWDWDPSSSLKRLFGTETSREARQPYFSPPREGIRGKATTGELDMRKLEVSLEGPPHSNHLLDRVRVRYETEAGDIKYRTFYAAASAEDVASKSKLWPCESLSVRTPDVSLAGVS